MKSIRVKYTDRKGESGSMKLPVKDTEVEAEILAVTALSYIGSEGYTELTETSFASPQSVGSSALVENDKDFKAICTFKGASGYFKISWPAPKINIEAGFVVRWGSERAVIPPVKETGETGNDGEAVAALVATMTGDSTVTFKSGHLYKRP
jgi:hypothetical protein